MEQKALSCTNVSILVFQFLSIVIRLLIVKSLPFIFAFVVDTDYIDIIFLVSVGD